MTKDEAFKRLGVEPMSFDEAAGRYEESRKAATSAGSDPEYWSRRSRSVQLLAAAVIAASEGDMPSLPRLGSAVVMDAQALLVEWCAKVAYDHEHEYQSCVHERHVKKGAPSHDKCTEGRTSFGYYHDVCGICGRSKYGESDIVKHLRAEVST